MSKITKEGKIVLFITLLLTAFGVYMVYSASRVWALAKYNDSFYFLKRQLIFALIGIAIMIILINFPIDKLFEKSNLLLLISFVFLIIVLIPGIGILRNGSRSWIGVGTLVFQPSEIFKITAIIFSNLFFSMCSSFSSCGTLIPRILDLLVYSCRIPRTWSGIFVFFLSIGWFLLIIYRWCFPLWILSWYRLHQLIFHFSCCIFQF